ncbi:MAG: prepilin-type N-terminal cleavage/methylation domain-containing protein [Gemmatimonadota bacterium]
MADLGTGAERAPRRGSLVPRRPGRLRRYGAFRRRRPQRLRPSRGFTLVEIMVAILLVGVGLMGLAAISTTVSRANAQSGTLTAATGLAQERVERFRTDAFASIANGSDTRDLDGVRYTRTWTVTNDVPAVGLKTIVVTVSWTSRGQTRSTSLRTIRGAR